MTHVCTDNSLPHLRRALRAADAALQAIPRCSHDCDVEPPWIREMAVRRFLWAKAQLAAEERAALAAATRCAHDVAAKAEG